MIDIKKHCTQALIKWGADSQILMAVEELSELIAILLQSRRLNREIDYKKVLEEIADVEILLTQLKIIYQKDKEQASSNFDNEYTEIFDNKALKFINYLKD